MNKVKYNLKNVYYSLLTETVGDSGTTTYNYATPVAIPGAVNLSLDEESSNDPFYADGIVYFRAISNNGYSGDLEVALLPGKFRTDVLGETMDTDKVLVDKTSTAAPPAFALLFEFDGDEKAIRHIMYHCTASRPSVSGKTKEESVEPETETLSLTCDPRSDGIVKTRTGDTTTSSVYSAWYTAVHEPDFTAGS